MNRPTFAALVLLAGCNVNNPSNTDEPDTDEPNGPGAPNTPIESSIDCTDFGGIEIWRLTDPAAGSYSVRVDTVSADTAFDPAVTIGTGFNTASTDFSEMWADVDTLANGDDEFDCTFPPPDYACPETTFTVADTTMAPMIAVENLGSCTGQTATYELSVTLDGAPVSVEQVASVAWTADDFPDTGI